MADKHAVRILILEGLDAADLLTLKTGGFFDGQPVTIPAGVTGQTATIAVPDKPPAKKAPPKAEPLGDNFAPGQAANTSETLKPAAAPVQQAIPAAAPVAPPPATQVAPAAAPAGARALTEPEVLEVSASKKLADVLRYMQGKGITEKGALQAECGRLRTAIPILSRIPEASLAERVGYTLDGMA